MSNTSGRCFRARRRTAERKQRQRERATRKIFEATAVKMGITPEYVAKMSNAYLASTIRHRRRRAPIIDRPDTIVATVDMALAGAAIAAMKPLMRHYIAAILTEENAP